MSMKKMYPAKNGSPSTELSVALTETATTIVVLDVSVLPAAPNIAVIGSDVNAEIITYEAITDNVLSGVVRGVNNTTAQAWPSGTIIGRNINSYDHDTFMENIESLDLDLDGAQDEITNLQTRMVTVENDIADLEAQMQFKRYGVSGVGLQSAALTRLYDAIGMTAEVGTDDPEVSVTNDFDHAAPFMHRKCVGNWVREGDHAKFNVYAYLGDENFVEDGSGGDYVAVELPLSFYQMDGNNLVISAHRYPGYRPFDIFCRDHDENQLLDKVYVPAYALALNEDGFAVSLPGLENEQGTYENLFKDARKYNNDDVAGIGMLMPAALQFYYWALYTVEFATQNCQAIMRGMADMRSDGNTRCKFLDAEHILVTDWAQAAQTSIAGWNANWRKPGDYLCVLATSVGDIHDARWKATHRVISVTRCDASGTASASGQYSLIEVEDLGKDYWTYDYTGGTDYKLAGRPYPTGACNNVATPSGSPRDNVGGETGGHNPMRYRYRENVFGNQFHTAVDLFDIKKGTNDSDWYLDWYYLPDPREIATPYNPSQAQLQAEPYVKLSLQTPHENYVNGYIVSKQYDGTYPDIWAPLLTSGGGDTKYFCDYAILVSSAVVRSVRFGGSWNSGSYDGLSYCFASLAPSAAFAYWGGDLCFPQ